MTVKKKFNISLIMLCAVLGGLLFAAFRVSAEHQTSLSQQKKGIAQNSRWNNVERQRFDYSCGAAALATLLRLQFQEKLTEKLILSEIISGLSESELAERKEHGLTLLDLKKQSEKRGYSAVGVLLDTKALPELKKPALVLLSNGTSRHFTVFNGIQKGMVRLADPARGNIRIPLSYFLKQWPGVALVLGQTSRRNLAESAEQSLNKKGRAMR